MRRNNNKRAGLNSWKKKKTLGADDIIKRKIASQACPGFTSAVTKGKRCKSNNWLRKEKSLMLYHNNEGFPLVRRDLREKFWGFVAGIMRFASKASISSPFAIFCLHFHDGFLRKVSKRRKIIKSTSQVEGKTFLYERGRHSIKITLANVITKSNEHQKEKNEIWYAQFSTNLMDFYYQLFSRGNEFVMRRNQSLFIPRDELHHSSRFHPRPGLGFERKFFVRVCTKKWKECIMRFFCVTSRWVCGKTISRQKLNFDSFSKR